MAALQEAVQQPGQLIWNPEALGCIVPPADESITVSLSADRKKLGAKCTAQAYI